MEFKVPLATISISSSCQVGSSRALALGGSSIAAKSADSAGGAAGTAVVVSDEEGSSSFEEDGSCQLFIDSVKDYLDRFSWVDSDPLDGMRIAGSVVQPRKDLPAPDREGLEALILRLVELLKIPRSCLADEEETNPTDLLQQERFLHHSRSLLELSLVLLRQVPISQTTLEFQEKVLFAFARFSVSPQHTNFVSPSASQVSSEICSLLVTTSPSRQKLLRHILSQTFPPFFKHHPKLNPSTGRALDRLRGGDRGMLDWYEESETQQGWRTEPGMGNIVHVVISGLQKTEIEDFWPLILPPLLAFLDDYDAKQKLRGIYLLEDLLKIVNGSLLKRTGVGRIFQQSLNSSFSTFTSPLSPSLLISGVSTSLHLFTLLHEAPPGAPSLTEAHFTSLSELLTSSVINTWEFKSGNIALESACASALPPILHAMGPGSIRYLQVLVPHLAGVLDSSGVVVEGGTKVGALDETAMRMMELVAGALEVLAQVARRRMHGWTTMVLLPVGKCWTIVRERGTFGEDTGGKERLEKALKSLVVALVEVSDEVREVDLPRLVAIDPTLFGDLVPPPSLGGSLG